MNQHNRVSLLLSSVIVATAAFLAMPAVANAADETVGVPVEVLVPDPSLQGDGTMGPAAAQAKNYGTLRLPSDMALKAAANRTHDEVVRSGTLGPAQSEAPSAEAPTVVSGHNFAGLIGGTADTNGTPPDNEGAIGTTRYIQTINSAVKIYDRSTNASIATGSLNALNGFGAANNSFDPQIIWDATTNRFYYSMDTIVSASSNLLTFGWSKSASPATVSAADWCQYAIDYHTPFPDYPKMGDSRYFVMIGVNVFANNSSGGFVGSDIFAFAKPAAGTTCPTAASIKTGLKTNLKDSGGTNQVFTPVPSNQIDNNNTGYVVTRNLSLPSTKLWFFNVTKNATGNPVFGSARGVTVGSYTVPAAATQHTFATAPTSTKIDTSDTRNTQAVQAINPARGTSPVIHSFWTQHTIASGSFSAVRWYEINPAPATPVVLRSGDIATANVFNFNGAIAPDRKKNNATVKFGQSFVIQYNQSSPTIAPRIVARSSLAGAAISAGVVIKAGVGPYRDFSCPTNGSECRWGDYAAMTPDPVPSTTAHGTIWGTNQFSGVASPPAGASNWRTQIFALKP